MKYLKVIFSQRSVPIWNVILSPHIDYSSREILALFMKQISFYFFIISHWHLDTKFTMLCMILLHKKNVYLSLSLSLSSTKAFLYFLHPRIGVFANSSVHVPFVFCKINYHCDFSRVKENFRTWNRYVVLFLRIKKIFLSDEKSRQGLLLRLENQ